MHSDQIQLFGEKKAKDHRLLISSIQDIEVEEEKIENDFNHRKSSELFSQKPLNYELITPCIEEETSGDRPIIPDVDVPQGHDD